MASLQPIKLYAHKKGPNPWKVALILEELGLPYETTYLEFPDAKVEPYISLNPNGKLPAIQDPNHSIELFESGAIIEYLIEQYDKDGKLSHESLQDKSLARAWLHLQMSAQAPVIGYKVWMGRTYDASQIVSANEFLTLEIKRVLGVLDKHLAKMGGPYLLGSKVSYADLAFVPHYMMLPLFVPDYDPATEYPHFAAWLAALKERPAVKKIAATKAALA
ncbi:Glutathione S-transferase 2 [Beauveria bassiana]|uniref:Glutathione S-transferase-like protein OpS6 n=1 Tax=Beauveria bassiana (strain ARSEF 2860) TaxID=655819 RepID=OPS6_BEAB2|nr:glutathione-s-transferase [Beauveria bassiana ARSEF 2860]J4UHQ8.1 RecName: Full=Glutathione S-transferase-like protein OpS6; AltName: Full=Oosporein biosynthesis protein 6 [Beauveria bassiana ARSEF 2860]EJP62797.1 glutathione-s-transferase [Beauveria bassiana ARSEF 2860]KAF1732861.1 Glutathione S-transferase 2 [Beauveria bassiana]KAH8713098.1 Glutathione S-transferase-like protein OpS6 [Beauveria bassiana]